MCGRALTNERVGTRYSRVFLEGRKAEMSESSDKPWREIQVLASTGLTESNKEKSEIILEILISRNTLYYSSI